MIFKEISFAKNCLRPGGSPLRLKYYNFQKNRIYGTNFVDAETTEGNLY